MFDAFIRKMKIVFEDVTLRKRVLFALAALMVFRLLAPIPTPSVNAEGLQAFLSNNQFFGLLNVFSGGGFSNLSIVMLGVGPYITASIVMQLLTVLVPKLKEMYQEEGIIPSLTFIALLTNVMVVAAGSMLLMWIGELITEFGVGNGVSLIIFA